jgi:hypothetical protein
MASTATMASARQRRPQPAAPVPALVTDAKIRNETRNGALPSSKAEKNGAVLVAPPSSLSKNEELVLSSATPPWHAILVLSVFIGVFASCLPGLQKLDEVAVVETFTARIFPELISVYQLSVFRGIFAFIIWGTTIQCWVSPGWKTVTSYLSGSKLKAVTTKLEGVKTLFPFTSW